MIARVVKDCFSQTGDDYHCSFWGHLILFAGFFPYISTQYRHRLQDLSLVSFLWESLYYTDGSQRQSEANLEFHEWLFGTRKSSTTDRPTVLDQSFYLGKTKVYPHHRPVRLSSCEYFLCLLWCSLFLQLGKVCLYWRLWCHSRESHIVQVACSHHRHQIAVAIHVIFLFLIHKLWTLSLFRLKAVTIFQSQCYCWLPWRCLLYSFTSRRSWNAKAFHWFVMNSFLPSVDVAIAYAARSNYDAYLSDCLQGSLLFKVSKCVSYDQPFSLLQVLVTVHLSQILSFEA